MILGHLRDLAQHPPFCLLPYSRHCKPQVSL